MSNGISHKHALKTIYGVEFDWYNAKQCRERLLMGSEDVELMEIVEHNIICADALDPKHSGWVEVGFYWMKS